MPIPLLLCALMQVASPATADAPITRRPALPALAAKAPGRPGYGLHITAPQGQFIFTNLTYSLGAPRGGGALYRVTGPAGWGPYRLGIELGIIRHYELPPDQLGFYRGTFLEIKKALDGGAAKAAGLDEDWSILSVDGQNFDWNLNTLVAYFTSRPSIEVQALKAKGWMKGIKQKTFHIQLRKLDPPPDPADGVLVSEQVPALQPYLADPRLWSELVALRSTLPRFTPLPMELSGKHIWAIRGAGNHQTTQGGPTDPITLEFWGEDPATGPKESYPDTLWPEPADGLREGRAMEVEGHWYRIQKAGVDPTSGRLLTLTLQPWQADVPTLLGGGDASRELGAIHAPALQESLEQRANEALVEWKTRTLPGLLASQNLGPAEDLVIRIEKGLLKLDLEVKGIRSRIDATARAEAERKAQAELAARDGKTAPQVQAAPATESERLADLLEQRKAILMAILGSAKQALSNLRR